jgi:hypothetical protein
MYFFIERKQASLNLLGSRGLVGVGEHVFGPDVRWSSMDQRLLTAHQSRRGLHGGALLDLEAGTVTISLSVSRSVWEAPRAPRGLTTPAARCHGHLPMVHQNLCARHASFLYNCTAFHKAFFVFAKLRMPKRRDTCLHVAVFDATGRRK